MDKTVSISLGGYALTVDEKAYQKLKHYLADIRNSLAGTEGIEEIISDVETRIAEILKQRLEQREVVNENDVDHVIEVMGSPSQYADDDVVEDDYKAEGYRTGKKLFRDPDEKYLGGVSSGLAHYFGLDSSWVRIFWVAMLLLGILSAGVSTLLVVLSYVILWAAIPEAKTTADKLQMRGKPVNFDSIKDFLGNGDELKENLKSVGDDIKKASQGSGNFLGKLIIGAAKILMWLIVAILVLIGLAIVIGLISTLFGFSFAGLALWDYLYYVFPNNPSQILSLIFLISMAVILILMVIFIALRIISARYAPSKYVMFGLISWFFVSLIGAGIIGFNTAREYSVEGELNKRVDINTNSDTLTIRSLASKNGEVIKIRDVWHAGDEMFQIRENNLERKIDSDLIVKPAPSDQYILEITYKSNARNDRQLEQKLNNIVHRHQLQGDVLELDRFISFPKEDKFRDQTAYATLYIPKGKSLKTEDLYKIIFKSDDNRESFYNPNGKIYTFDGEFLNCDTCVDEGEIEEAWDAEDLGEEIHLDWKVDGDEGSIRIGTDKKGIVIDGENGIVNIIGDSVDLKIDESGMQLNGKEAKKIKIDNKTIITNGTDSVSISD